MKLKRKRKKQLIGPCKPLPLLKSGTRVTHKYFGKGKVVSNYSRDVVSEYGVILVEFDTPTPMEYNMGHNPALVRREDLELLNWWEGLV